MNMVQKRRRVSYVIPPPSYVPRLLQLPPRGLSRLGSVGPLLIPAEGHTADDERTVEKRDKHSRHRLGVSSLVLDTSTRLVGRGAPEGILYSGGRDGMIMSWDLGIPMKKRKAREDSEGGLKRSHGRWEIITGWVDHGIDEEGEDVGDLKQSDGDILGDVTASTRKRQKAKRNSIPYENQWETDVAAFKPGKPTEFRQCVQANMDWINDILLCNYNQTVISASSDGTVKSWSPHSSNSSDPSTLGTHTDYVRCLTHSREQSWVASGSFDRTIKLWDLSRSEQHDALVTLNPADANAPKSSVYALATDPFGHTIVSGSPERVIRLWDPRTGKRTGKLVGHTDNIRAILISDDSKYLLTGSTDASIKLWSLASQRCLHTFTHHTESVWSLHSSHPSLETFYSGDRSGLVCKVDVENCSDISEGECVLLCQDADPTTPSSDGVNTIVAMDDNLVWTASGRSSIKRWLVPQSVQRSASVTDLDSEHHRRTESPVFFRHKDRGEVSPEPDTRPSTSHGPGASFPPSIMSASHDDETEATRNGIPFESLVRLVSPNEPFPSYSSPRGHDPEVATLYSAASIRSVPRNIRLHSPTQATFKDSPLRSGRTEDSMHLSRTARTMYEERDLATNAVPLRTEPDDIILGEHGLVRCTILNDRIHALVVDTSGEVAVWDIVRGVCMGRFLPDDVATASTAGSVAGESNGDHERSPREALETVRERIEGEAVISSWSSADTKAGVLMVHLNEKCFDAEIYADEVGFAQDRRFHDESKINIGKWVLRNLFLGFIREEQRSRRAQDDATGNSDGILTPSLTRVSSSITQPDLRIDIPHRPASSSPDSSKKPRNTVPSSTVSSANMIPALPPTEALPPSSPLLTPMVPLQIQDVSFPPLPLPNADHVTSTPLRARSGTIDHGNTVLNISGTVRESDSFSRARLASQSGPAPDDLNGPPQISSTPGGIMGRLKNLGGKMTNKRPASEFSSSPVPSSNAPTEAITVEENLPPTEKRILTPLEVLLSGPLSPPPSIEAPTYTFPHNTILFISEEISPSFFTTVYRGSVANTKYDVQILEEAMPMWLIEYLLMSKMPPLSAPIKISFVLIPWPTKDPKERLPELLNTQQSKLTASRYLRVRKLVIHVQEKLDKVPANSRSDEEQNPKPLPRAEDVYEILCNDVVMPLGMSLAAIRQCVWKHAAELVLHYRRIEPSRAPQERRPSV